MHAAIALHSPFERVARSKERAIRLTYLCTRWGRDRTARK